MANKMQLIDWGQRARDIREIFGAIDGVLPNGQPVDAESARLMQDAVPIPVVPAGSQAAPPAWHSDPTGRHEQRYWDGHAWSEHVADAGEASTDPVA